MPLLKGQPYRPTEQLPPGLKRNHEVWVIRTTGEVFLDYELYLQKVRLYREPAWTCTRTSRSGLSYLQAVASENAQRTEEDVALQKEPLTKPPPCLQMTLTSAVMQPTVDMDLQLLGPFLRNEARSIVSAIKPDGLEGVLAVDSGNQTSDGKKRRSSAKDSDHTKPKSDAKKIPGTVKHTIYETLKWVGANGASISYLHQRLKDCKIQTTWADSSARNCIASLLNHDKAFVKLPKHGHYALASYVKAAEDEAENEKRELSTNEQDAADCPRNNGRCMKCLKAKHPDNSPLVFCDRCPSAIHAVCAEEYDAAMRDVSQEEGGGGIKYPYLCYKCVQKRKMAERQKVVRQKREEEKQKRQEERNQRLNDAQDKGKDLQSKKRLFPHKPPVARYPIEDLDLTPDDHRHKEALLNGPLLPDPHHQSEIMLDALAVCEFLSMFGAELDDRPVIADLTVAEFMYSLCWPLDSSLLKNTYQALLKTAIHQAMKLSDAPPDMRQWNAVLDGYTWPEILKFYFAHQQEHDIIRQIHEALQKHEKGDEMTLFLELPPELHLKILSALVMYVSSSAMLRQSTDARLSEAKHLESAITKIRREMNKPKSKTQTAATNNSANQEQDGERTVTENGESGKRHLRRRGATEEDKEAIAQNELASLEEQLERCKVRCEPIGFDRHRNEYYWFPSLPESLCVINPEQTHIRCLRGQEDLDRVMSGLNLRGIREKQLMEALKRDYENLCICLAPAEFSFDVNNVPRGVPCAELESFHKASKKQSRAPVEKLKHEHISCALKMMVNRLYKVVGGVASVAEPEIQDEIKTRRIELSNIATAEAMLAFLSELNDVLKRVFQDGTEKQNGKTQMKLTAHLESFDVSSNMSLSELGLYVATLREIIDPLVRAKSKAQQVAAEAKRKRGEKSTSEKSTTSSDFAAPTKKIKQKHETSEDVNQTTDMLAFDAVPWRVTRSHTRRGIPANVPNVIAEGSSSSGTLSEISDSNRLDDVTDDDYEVAQDSDDEQGSTNEEARCRVCGFGGRLIECSGLNCDATIHRACMYGGRGNETQWYCSKCARTQRALFRNDRNN